MDADQPLTTTSASKPGESKYERQKKIGIGSYGVVFKCVNRQNGQVVAIKRYSENDSDPVIRKIAMREVRMLRQLKHPNLIRLIEVFRRKRRLHLVFDYCELTVLDVIEKYANSCPLNLIKKIIWQTVNAIKYCHEHNCIHRDIKPENILINQAGIVKLCDFGFARSFAKPAPAVDLKTPPAGRVAPDMSQRRSQQSGGLQERQAFTDYVATRWYRAPELLIGEIYYDLKIDIWAIGCVTAELMRGEPMWPGKTDYDQLSIIRSSLGQLTGKQTQTLLDRAIYDQSSIERLINQSATKPTGANPEALERKLPARVGQAGVDFVSACLQMDPSRRPASTDLLQHTFIRSLKMGQFVEAAEKQVRKSVGSMSNSDVVKRLLGSRSSVPARRAGQSIASELDRPLTLPQLADGPTARDCEHLAPVKQPLVRSKQKRKYDQQLQASRPPKSFLPVSTTRRLSQGDTGEPSRVASTATRLPLMPLSTALNQQVVRNGCQPKRWRRPSAGANSGEPPSQRTKIAVRAARQAQPDKQAPGKLIQQQSGRRAKDPVQSGSGNAANQLAGWQYPSPAAGAIPSLSARQDDGKIYCAESDVSSRSNALGATHLDLSSSSKRIGAKPDALPALSTPTKRHQREPPLATDKPVAGGAWR